MTGSSTTSTGTPVTEIGVRSMTLSAAASTARGSISTGAASVGSGAEESSGFVSTTAIEDASSRGCTVPGSGNFSAGASDTRGITSITWIGSASAEALSFIAGSGVGRVSITGAGLDSIVFSAGTSITVATSASVAMFSSTTDSVVWGVLTTAGFWLGPFAFSSGAISETGATSGSAALITTSGRGSLLTTTGVSAATFSVMASTSATSFVSGTLGSVVKRGRMCIDAGGGDDANVLFSAALTGTIMMGTKGAIGEGDNSGALSSIIVGDLMAIPGGRVKSSLYFGVGIEIYMQGKYDKVNIERVPYTSETEKLTFGMFMGSIPTALCIAAPKPDATYASADDVPSRAAMVLARSARNPDVCVSVVFCSAPAILASVVPVSDLVCFDKVCDVYSSFSATSATKVSPFVLWLFASTAVVGFSASTGRGVVSSAGSMTGFAGAVYMLLT